MISQLPWLLCFALGAGGQWAVQQGSCVLEGDGCIVSTNYPSKYPNNDLCTIQVDSGNTRPIRVDVFDTESGWDHLVVNGVEYDGTSGPDGVVPTSNIQWTSDRSETDVGWRICLESIVAVTMTTTATSTSTSTTSREVTNTSTSSATSTPTSTVTEVTSTSSATTTETVTNTTSTRSTATSSSRTTLTTTTSTVITTSSTSSTTHTATTTEGLWRVAAGSCKMDPDGCMHSVNFEMGQPYPADDSCDIEMRANNSWAIEVIFFKTQAGVDRLEVNGLPYSGTRTSDGPSGVVPQGRISWRSDEVTQHRGWMICLGEVPTTTTTTTTTTEAAWFVAEGSCALGNDGCISSSRYGTLNYPPNDACTITLINESRVLQVEAFNTEQSWDRLTVNGLGYSGPTRREGPNDVIPAGNITWLADARHFMYKKHADELRHFPGRLHLYKGLQSSLPRKRVVEVMLEIKVMDFQTEQRFDTLTVNGIKYSGVRGPDKVVPQGDYDNCEIAVSEGNAKALKVEHFNLDFYDHLVVNSIKYDWHWGSVGPQGVVPQGTITWSTVVVNGQEFSGDVTPQGVRCFIDDEGCITTPSWPSNYPLETCSCEYDSDESSIEGYVSDPYYRYFSSRFRQPVGVVPEGTISWQPEEEEEEEDEEEEDLIQPSHNTFDADLVDKWFVSLEISCWCDRLSGVVVEVFGWTVLRGNCKMDRNGCIHTVGYRRTKYPENDFCDIKVRENNYLPIYEKVFRTKAQHGILTVNGLRYSGWSGPDGVVPQGTIQWRSDAANDFGWELCLQVTTSTTTQVKSWTVRTGHCRVDAENCLVSPGYPSTYLGGESCTIEVHPELTTEKPVISVTDFFVNDGYDHKIAGFLPKYDQLVVNDVVYKGKRIYDGPEGVAPSGLIYFLSDKKSAGYFRLCMRKANPQPWFMDEPCDPRNEAFCPCTLQNTSDGCIVPNRDQAHQGSCFLRVDRTNTRPIVAHIWNNEVTTTTTTTTALEWDWLQIAVQIVVAAVWYKFGPTIPEELGVWMVESAGLAEEAHWVGFGGFEPEPPPPQPPVPEKYPFGFMWEVDGDSFPYTHSPNGWVPTKELIYNTANFEWYHDWKLCLGEAEEPTTTTTTVFPKVTTHGWQITRGNCQMCSNGCITSPGLTGACHETFSVHGSHYYPLEEDCEIRVDANNQKMLHVDFWQLGHDAIFSFNGIDYNSGADMRQTAHAIVPQHEIIWRTVKDTSSSSEDSVRGGWKICLKEAKQTSWAVTQGTCKIDADDCLVNSAWPNQIHSVDGDCEIEMKPGVIKAIVADKWQLYGDVRSGWGDIYFNRQGFDGYTRDWIEPWYGSIDEQVPVGTIKYWNADPEHNCLCGAFRLCLKEGDYTTTTTTPDVRADPALQESIYGWSLRSGTCWFDPGSGCISSDTWDSSWYEHNDLCRIDVVEGNQKRIRMHGYAWFWDENYKRVDTLNYDYEDPFIWRIGAGDTLVVNGLEFDSGSKDRPEGLVPQGSIVWTTDGSDAEAGWKLCLEEVPPIEVISGSCERLLDEPDCVASKDYPEMSTPEDCLMHVPEGNMRPLMVVDYEVEERWVSHLSVDTTPYSAFSKGKVTIVPQSRVRWEKHGQSRPLKWKICLEDPLTTTVTSTSTIHWQVRPGSGWRVEGTCRLQIDGCISSGNFPSRYPDHDRCVIEVDDDNTKVLKVRDWSVGYGDELRICHGEDGLFQGEDSLCWNRYGRDAQPADGLVPRGFIYWTTDGDNTAGFGSGSGWQICLEEVFGILASTCCGDQP
ncbi:unnamed protein product [Symbiodinium sp. CCMP2592]|nr:unnamed protein product [Symbiodinium sp. CCMP2592]